jgi:hypothetical protein
MVADLMAIFVGFDTVIDAATPFAPDSPLSTAIWSGKQYVFEVRPCRAWRQLRLLMTYTLVQAVCPSYNASECVGDVPRP